MSACTSSRVVVAMTAAFLLSSGVARAERSTAAARERARVLVYEGRDQRAIGALPAALESFKKAHAIMGVPTTGLELAKTQVAAGQLLDARSTLNDVLRSPSRPGEPPAFANARAEAQALLEHVARRVASVTIVAPADVAHVELDSAIVEPEKMGTAIPVDPGRHEIVVVAADGEEKRHVVELGEHGSETVRVSFAPPPPPAPARPRTIEPVAPLTRTNPLVYVGGAILAVGGVTGSITGGMTLHTRSSVEGRCGAACPPEVQDDIERGKTLGTASTVAFAVAGAGALLMFYGLLFPSERHRPMVGQGGASIAF